jgi:predicted phosphodiesterase
MQVIIKDIPYTRPDIFKIFPMGDLHLGTVHCAEGEIHKQIRTIQETKNSYIIGMGDWCDCITLNDKRFDMKGLAPWVEPDNIIECQRKKAVATFKPVQNKIIAILEGNHEDAIHHYHQNHIIKNICADLDSPFGEYHCFILLRFKRSGGESHVYTIHAWHGSGSAQTDGARLNRLTRLVNDIQADIYLMGHLHAMTQHTPDRLIVRNGKIKSIKLAATITGSWVKAYTQGETVSYAEKKGYKPSRIGCPVVCINPDKDNFWIES